MKLKQKQRNYRKKHLRKETKKKLWTKYLKNINFKINLINSFEVFSISPLKKIYSVLTYNRILCSKFKKWLFFFSDKKNLNIALLNEKSQKQQKHKPLNN